MARCSSGGKQKTRILYRLRTRNRIIGLLGAALEADENMNILSSYYTDTRALLEKKKWLDKYLPGISSSHCLFVPYGKNKAEFVETMLHRKLGKMDILVDDHTPNLKRWETAGGTGIKWLNGINGKNGRFEGIRVGSVEELKEAFDKIADRKAVG